MTRVGWVLLASSFASVLLLYGVTMMRIDEEEEEEGGGRRCKHISDGLDWLLSRYNASSSYFFLVLVFRPSHIDTYMCTILHLVCMYLCGLLECLPGRLMKQIIISISIWGSGF